MKTTKVVLKSLVVLGAVFALVACGSKQESTSTSSSTTETVVLKDGTYKAESGKDDYGYKIVHTLTVKDGKISESKFDYEAEDGSLKSANEEYNKNMKDKAGVSAGEAIEQLNAALVEKQDLSAVEVVSGATHTSEDFKKSTEALLAAAAEGKTETVKLD
ncbi:TPA: FMN-binding protein [Streptococcus suis]|uniref:Lipoprotein n=4 Tax=Streptococcus suis TaxID=1307 RepID=A0A0H3MXI4_STRS4|nr:FMN-binding protein [Streptococcus suis]ABP90720.1 Major membrane immunogen, membrane-anchored lipoprotein [Streptococcus suis 05ZYH33]ABP92923.1 Major membrane immunogen, membrane-anchored lipoprotein [Streptococcus suis 98HAH33]ADE32037.1 pheromone cAD1 precursor lipoprotein [Streptococcus suis GZ1]ADV70779.1 major membrane immunogen, membrane-anchored lipoprotein [Streptococcus suis JS14]AER15874.1 major membrane immunogen, membrane-anchored lipoprotein [Streptococcus suis SS12]